VVADDQDDELGDLPGGLGEYGESSQLLALPVFELVQQLAWGEHRRQRVVEPGQVLIAGDQVVDGWRSARVTR
jgi:hypothetical protein